MTKKTASKKNDNLIAVNKKARHDYFIEETFEAGLVLEGWEVKSLRAKKIQLNESYVLLKDGEASLFGAHISPLSTVSTHIHPDPVRTRKLLLHNKELSKLFGSVKREGYTCIPLELHWKKGYAKCTIGLAKGKKQYDKRATERERDWNLQKQRVMRQHNR